MKIIKEFPNYYVTENGKVINTDTGRILKEDTNSCGYLRVTLSKNSKTKRFFIHRLVAELYLEEQQELKQVNHIDGNKQNNHFSNLEWCNQSMNQKHAYQIGLQIVKTKVSEDQVRTICEYLSKGYPVKKIIRIMDVTRDIVADIKRKKTWKHISSNYNF